jgi:hypothetical protein
MKSFESFGITNFEFKITEGEYEKWQRILTHLNVSGPYGYMVQNKCVVPGNSEVFMKKYSIEKKITVPDKLIQHFIYGKTLLVSGFLGDEMDHFDVQLCCDDKSIIQKLITEFNLCIYELNNKYYLSIKLDVKTFVWHVLKKFTYKLKKLTGYEIGMRGKPAYTQKIVVNGQDYYKICYDSNLMELDRSLLKDSVFEKFMKRAKTPISKLEEFVSDVPDNYEALDFDDFALKFNTDSMQLLWGDDDLGGGETIKPLINTQPERTLGKVEPCSRRFGGDTSDESSSPSISNHLKVSANLPPSSAEEPAAPSRPAVLSALVEKSLVSNISFIVSPPPKWQAMVQQLTFIYKSGTNAVERFCYKQYIEGGKKAKLRKRYITKDKFISYAIAIINSCWFSKNNCQTIKYMKLIFKGLNTNVKWDNHDFYYVLDILLLIGIINKVTNSYKVGSHGKQYEFVRGSLSRFCSEGIYFEFPVL